MSTHGIARVCREAIALLVNGQIAAAQAVISDALKSVPDEPNVLYVAGNVALARGDQDAALALYEQAVARVPEFPAALLNLGFVLRQKHRLPEARTVLRRCVDLTPADPHAWLNLTATYVNEGEPAEGESVAREALRHCPTSPDLRWNLGLLLLEQCRWGEGWEECVHRFETPVLQPPRYVTPGEPPKRLMALDQMKPGCLVVCHGEQGLGDEILFAGMLREFVIAARDRGGVVLLDCHPRLRGVFGRNVDVPLVDEAIAEGRSSFLHPIDWLVPIGDLGLFFRSKAADFPDHGGYLSADPQRVGELRKRLKPIAAGRRLVGLAWTGGTSRTHSRYRTMPLCEWLPLLRQNCCVVSLEYRDRTSEIAELTQSHGIEILQVPDFTAAEDVEAVFAAVAAVDLVVTVPTTVLHVAGAVGKPCLIAMHHKAAWRECSGDSGLAWYPRTHERFVREAEEPNWASVVDAIVKRTRELALF